MKRTVWLAHMTHALLAYVGGYLLLFLVPLLAFWLMSKGGPPQAMVFLAAQKAALGCVPIGIFFFVLLERRRTRRLSSIVDEALKDAPKMRPLWLTRMTNALVAFVGAYLLVFLGPLLLLWMWTTISLTQEMVSLVAKKSALFSVPIGLILFVSLERRTCRISSTFNDESKAKS
jgi:hypothetical protein